MFSKTISGHCENVLFKKMIIFPIHLKKNLIENIMMFNAELLTNKKSSSIFVLNC